MFARAQTWWTILRIALQERLVYRGDFALGTLMRFLPIVTQILPAKAFYPAEDYHQDFYLKDPLKYKFYRFNCRRDARLYDAAAQPTQTISHR